MSAEGTTTSTRDAVAGPSGSWPNATWEAWRETVERDLRGAPFEKRLVTRTYEGLEIQPVYTARDWDSCRDPTGAPGFVPMVRGAHVLGRARGGWEVREERGETDLETLNRAILDDLEHGATSVELRLNDGAAVGLDHTGSQGAMVFTLDDLDRALGGVHLEMIGVGFTPGCAFLGVGALADALWTERGVSRDEARFAVNADPLAELARTGALDAPVDRVLGRLGSLGAWTRERWPSATSVRVNSSPYHDAGATAAQDLALSMATGAAYLRAMERAGLDPSAGAAQIAFQYSVSCNVFLAVAKLRAARRLWSRLLEACGVGENNRRMRMEVRTGRRSLTHRDPWVNMLRNTTCCFAGAVAGADTIISVPFDAPLGEPGELGRRIARNTQVILSEEAHLDRVLDPAGGSWYIERLTDELAHLAWGEFQQIEREGGMPSVLTSGWVRERINSSFGPRERNIARRKDAVVGVSEFPNPQERVLERPVADADALARSAHERLGSRTVGSGHKEALERARREADGAGVMKAVCEAVGEGASLGELAGVLRGVAEECVEIAPLAPHWYAEPFEALRDASDAYLAQCGRRPRVFLANMGPISEHTPRANYATDFFGAGGFEVIGNDGFERASDVGEAFGESGAHIAVVCSSDKRYESCVPDVASALREHGARTVVLAGRPGAMEEAHRASGVDRFIFIGCDVLATLRELLGEEGVLS